MNALEVQGFITLARTQPAKKRGKERKIYTLTLTGLTEFLAWIAKDLKNNKQNFNADGLDPIAKNYANLLPLIFGKWGLLQGKKVLPYGMIPDPTIHC